MKDFPQIRGNILDLYFGSVTGCAVINHRAMLVGGG